MATNGMHSFPSRNSWPLEILFYHIRTAFLRKSSRKGAQHDHADQAGFAGALHFQEALCYEIGNAAPVRAALTIWSRK
jgi:hypothetical protein